ncbi:MAG: DNA methylase [Nitrospirae bacterium RIFCSPLOWO2_01_FULL_62_17]|nr:MAG: DNA methylase [Nitrospirae bacterium RIFCSPLOWO2_01_FULL_62_17]
MDGSREQFFAPCPRGLESVLADELKELGAQVLAPTPGGVGFTGPFDLCYRVNLECRTASRVLWRIWQGPYRSEQDLYEAAIALPWWDWFSADRTIKVKVSAQQCPLKSLDFVTLRIKDAVCDKFFRIARARPSVDTANPDVRIDAFLDATHATLYLDTSGEPLFKRGFRAARTEAPLRENLAAGILKLTGWTPDQALLDPMCGGGTFLLEAAQIALRIAPGLGRRFAFEKLGRFQEPLWRALCEESRARQQPETPLGIYGSDVNGAVLDAAKANLNMAGLADAVTLKQVSILDIKPPADAGIMVMNPPYGIRTGEQDDLAGLYPLLGDVLKQRFAGWRAYIFTADLRLPKLIRLTPSRRTPLFNGALECRLYEFKLVEGSMRRKLPATAEEA